MSRFRKRMLEEEHQRDLNKINTSESSEAIGSTDSVFLTYSQTATQGDRTVTTSASISLPIGYDADAVLSLLRAKVNGTDHIPNAFVV